MADKNQADELNDLMKSLGINPSTLGTSKGATSSVSGIGTVYMPSSGADKVKRYNLLAQQAQDIENAIARATSGGSFSGASLGAQQQRLEQIRTEMKIVQAQMVVGDKRVHGYDEMDYESARLLPTGWSPEQLKRFVNKGIMYGIPGFDVGMGMPEIVAAWDELVKSSAAFSSKG